MACYSVTKRITANQETVESRSESSPYPNSEFKGEPHSWQPLQMRSSVKYLSRIEHILLLRNILSSSDSGRCFQVSGRKISPIDAQKVALLESVRCNTSKREQQSCEHLSSCTFQFIDCCPLCCVSLYTVKFLQTCTSNMEIRHETWNWLIK